MLESIAFLIFASAIWYVIAWSVRNDDRVPPDQRKRRFDPRNLRRPQGGTPAERPEKPTTDRRK